MLRQRKETMKNYFLYTARDSDTFRHIEHFLKRLPVNARLITLPPGSQFTSPLCLELRSNDILILVAEEEQDINDLLILHDEYDSFRILLIVRNEQQLTANNYRLLTPRMVFCLDSNLDDLPAYLINLLKSKS